MPKATLIFSLPEEEHEHDIASHAIDWYNVVFDVDEWLRKEVKYSSRNMIEVQVVRDRLREIMKEYELEFKL